MESFWDKYALPFMVSVTLHAMVIAGVLVGLPVKEDKREIKKPNYVQAKLVTLDAQSQAKPPKPKVVDLTKQREEEERRQAREEEKKRQEKKQQQEAIEKRKKLEAERREKEAAEAEAKKKAQAEKQAREEAEAERKKQEQLRRAREQEAFEEALADEESTLAELEYAATAQSYISAISQRIEQNWNRPPSARKGMECELSIELVPTGRVVSVSIVRSSGNDQFDRSAVQAVNKAEQFPEIKEMKPEVFERYYRELRLVFNPQDLRQ